MRLIDADALEKDYRIQFESVYKHIRNSVKPSDFFVERKAAYDKELVRQEMEAFCEFLQSRPIIDAEPVRHSRMSNPSVKGVKPMCLECHTAYIKDPHWNYCPFCGTKMDGGAE